MRKKVEGKRSYLTNSRQFWRQFSTLIAQFQMKKNTQAKMNTNEETTLANMLYYILEKNLSSHSKTNVLETLTQAALETLTKGDLEGTGLDALTQQYKNMRCVVVGCGVGVAWFISGKRASLDHL